MHLSGARSSKIRRLDLEIQALSRVMETQIGVKKLDDAVLITSVLKIIVCVWVIFVV